MREKTEKEVRHEGQIFSKADVREVQGDQEKGIDPHYLRESEAQTETGLMPVVYLHYLSA